MGIDSLDVLTQEMPELFNSQSSDVFDEEWIVVPIEEPEYDGDPFARVSDGEADWNFYDWEVFGADVFNSSLFPAVSPDVMTAIGGPYGGVLTPYTDRSKMPPTDSMAFYLPFHYFHPDWWGVYLTFEGVLWLAREIVRRSMGSVTPHKAIRVARRFLYYHEAFHHKTECFATRLEVTHRRALYRTAFESLYGRVFGTADCLEEGLANATALKDSWSKLRHPDIRDALQAMVLDSPPGYDRGVSIAKAFHSTRNSFAEDNQIACFPHTPRRNPELWGSTTHLFSPLANIKSRVNYVIPRNSPIVERAHFRPLLPPNKLIKKLKDMAKLEFVRNGGNHDVYRLPSGKIIPVPRHQRDLGRGIVKKILREAGISMGLEEFMRA